MTDPKYITTDEIADQFAPIIRKVFKDNPGLSLPVLAALGCGLLFNAVKNHPDAKGASDEYLIREMHRLVDNFLDTFTPTTIN